MKLRVLLVLLIFFFACKKNSQSVSPTSLNVTEIKINDQNAGSIIYNTNLNPVIKISFTAALDTSSVNSNISIFPTTGGSLPISISFINKDSTVQITSLSTLLPLTKYNIRLSPDLRSKENVVLGTTKVYSFITQIDSTDKFALLTDNVLLDTVQRRTFRYFWEFGHPVSGMARDRNTSGDVVTSGGTGFGVMSILSAINRNFITRTEGLNRITTIVNFLTNNCTRYHGAFAHWVNGATGSTIPFTVQDNGADLVETSFLMQGLLCARQYFNTSDPGETSLRTNINTLWNGVEWNWFRQNNQNVLYWHWSPDYNWALNVQIKGWDEALIVYLLAASSNTSPIPRIVYDNGWASNGAERNGSTYYGIQLPLGPAYGGPLFFAHYSFLGLNPSGLADSYANYWTQNVAHSRINYTYCQTNPGGYFGYSDLCWGLTASDDNVSGYAAHAPYSNDDGVIAPTAAISSLPYLPTESMNALRFFYYKLGDKIWGQYGFMDAFNLSALWYSNTYLAIDQGPEIIMIENYRSGLLWNLFMSCPEITNGMSQLGF
jgi:hypothetical protein